MRENINNTDDLEKSLKDIFRNFSEKFKNSSSPHPGQPNKLFIIIGIIILLGIWALSGFFIVSPAERAVILQFGKYHETLGPGLHWIPWGPQSKKVVNVQKISNFSYRDQMLTKDQNIVDVSVAIQYRIGNAKDYLHHLVLPDETVRQATAAVLRQVIGDTNLDQVLTSGRALVRQFVFEHLNHVLEIYHSGIILTDVALQPAKAPAEVKAAFDDAIKAQEDEERYQNQAQAYANNVIPVAEGKAKRILQEAKAYQQKVILSAKGEVARFNSVYSVYKEAPTVTQSRLYVVTMENILAKQRKVLIDVKENHNLLYLPLDKLWSSMPDDK